MEVFALREGASTRDLYQNRFFLYQNRFFLYRNSYRVAVRDVSAKESSSGYDPVPARSHEMKMASLGSWLIMAGQPVGLGILAQWFFMPNPMAKDGRKNKKKP